MRQRYYKRKAKEKPQKILDQRVEIRFIGTRRDPGSPHIFHGYKRMWLSTVPEWLSQRYAFNGETVQIVELWRLPQ